MNKVYSFDFFDLIVYFIVLSFFDFIFGRFGLDYWPLIAAFGFSFKKNVSN